MPPDLDGRFGRAPIAELVARVPATELAKIQGDVAAIQLAVDSVNGRILAAYKESQALGTSIARRSQFALLLKAVGVFGGIIVVSGFFPTAVRYVGLAIMLAGGLDTLVANHGRLMNEVKKKDALDELVESVEEVDGATVSVLRMASADPAGAVKSYADFMQQLQTNISKGHREVRHAARVWEQSVLQGLSVPAYPTASSATPGIRPSPPATGSPLNRPGIAGDS